MKTLDAKQETHQLVGQAKRRATKICPKRSKAAFSVAFSNFDKCPQEVAGDVIPGAALVDVGMDVRVIFSDFRLNSGQVIRLFDRPDPFYALLCST